MLLPKLREEVLEANLELVRRGLVLYTFGNASGISREASLIVIKPSGVPYETMKLEHLVVTDLYGKIIEGNLRPSSDLATHLVLYKAFPKIDGVSHTHSEYATAWAQARKSIPCLGTTHADYFRGAIPVRNVSKNRVVINGNPNAKIRRSRRTPPQLPSQLTRAIPTASAVTSVYFNPAPVLNKTTRSSARKNPVFNK
jgi:L-ribulose-5-phosphate 4-epimerase